MTEIEEYILEIHRGGINDIAYAEHIKKVIDFGKKIMEYLGLNSMLFLEYERAACMVKGLRIEGAYRVGKENGKPDKCLTCPNQCPTKCPTEHTHP